MLGLFGTLGLGSRALQAQQRAIETAGHNLANVNNPAYARQRVHLTTSNPLTTALGAVGTGVEATEVIQVRDRLLDRRIATEGSVSGYWEAQQRALQHAQAGLGQTIDRQASGAEGTSAAAGSQRAIAEGLQDLFSAFQAVATNPTSLTDRQTLLQRAETLAHRFSTTDQRLGTLRDELNERLQDDVTDANQLLAEIADLNDDIQTAEASSKGVANDLRDRRQEKIEALARLANVDVVEDTDGFMNISLGGTSLVSGKVLNDTLATQDPGTGALVIRTATAGTPLTLTGGTLQGTIEVRDGALADLRNGLNAAATELITRVNAIHSAGYSLTGTTGAAFFTGTGAADMGVNSALVASPALVQAAGVPGAVGDNQAVLAMARLAEARIPALDNQTVAQHYAHTVAALGQALASANEQVSDQEAVAAMLTQQRAAVSGVSLDEEMTDLVKFQKAFTASARLINTVDEMLEIVMNLKR